MKILFWNVDTQFDFMRDDESHKGTLVVPGATEIEGNLEKLTRFARENDIVLVNTGDWHTDETKEISDNPDFANTFPEHCMIGAKGAEYVPATAPENAYVIDWRDKTFDEAKLKRAKEIVMYKDHFGIFEGNTLAERVVEVLDPDMVYVYGVAKNVCVDYAVMGLLNKKRKVAYVIDAIKGLPGLPDPEEKWNDAKAVKVYTADVLKELATAKTQQMVK